MITIKEKHKNENIEELTRIVFEECGLEGELIIDDWDIYRIYITKEERKWIIRAWNIRENNKGRVVIDWTLYRMTPDGSCSEARFSNLKIKIKSKDFISLLFSFSS